MLEARDVTFAYGTRCALVGVSLVVAVGEVVALIGPNGSGKTTLLRVLRGVLRPQSGEVLWEGKPLVRFSPRELAQAFGVIVQDARVGFRMTVLEYVLQARFPYSRGFGFESEADVRSALWALQLTRALEFKDRWMTELSGGERQRVVLARALAVEPRVLLLDEPTANLDLRFQVEMLSLIRRLTRERALSSVFVAHELNLVAEFADRVLLLKDGRPLAFGSPSEVLTEAMLQHAFGIRVCVDRNPLSGLPRITVSGREVQSLCPERNTCEEERR